MNSLVYDFLKLEFNIAKKYHLQLLFNIVHIATIIILFHYISETFGVVEILNGPYFPFVASGLAFNYLSSGIISSSSNKIIEWRDIGVLEGILLSPIKQWKIYLAAGSLEAFISLFKFSLIIFFVAVFFIDITMNNITLSIFFLTISLTVLISLSLSLIETSSLLIWKKTSIISNISSLFSLFLSGIYFPIDILPKALQSLALLNPFFHALMLTRESLGIHSPDNHLVTTESSILTLIIWLIISSLGAVTFYKISERKLFNSGGHSHI